MAASAMSLAFLRMAVAVRFGFARVVGFFIVGGNRRLVSCQDRLDEFFASHCAIAIHIHRGKHLQDFVLGDFSVTVGIKATKRQSAWLTVTMSCVSVTVFL